jgi:hypothetical protein
MAKVSCGLTPLPLLRAPRWSRWLKRPLGLQEQARCRSHLGVAHLNGTSAAARRRVFFSLSNLCLARVLPTWSLTRPDVLARGYGCTGSVACRTASRDEVFGAHGVYDVHGPMKRCFLVGPGALLRANPVASKALGPSLGEEVTVRRSWVGQSTSHEANLRWVSSNVRITQSCKLSIAEALPPFKRPWVMTS